MKCFVLWDLTPCSPVRDKVSEEYLASIFRIEYYTKLETYAKHVANRANYTVSYPRR
jgi:hypothetical protein